MDEFSVKKDSLIFLALIEIQSKRFIAPPPSRIEILQETIVTDDAVGEFDTPSERTAKKVQIDLV
ncbi:hypothetical protein A0H81_13336 [Grifola frondosa]|uniref:Uncharacterized protein n=1 Tax=Grifola frondosa TaxID=5627 RepID=A0A1C7LQ26_GRIFR|nr:hypothetical protein A0H81_13336 [Grifola frondosa]